jgi:hypothetical protein
MGRTARPNKHQAYWGWVSSAAREHYQSALTIGPTNRIAERSIEHLARGRGRLEAYQPCPAAGSASLFVRAGQTSRTWSAWRRRSPR